MRKRFAAAAVMIIAAVSFCAAQQKPATDPWLPLKPFVGEWESTIQGEPGHGTGHRTYAFVLNGRYLEVKNTSILSTSREESQGRKARRRGLLQLRSRAQEIRPATVPRRGLRKPIRAAGEP